MNAALDVVIPHENLMRSLGHARDVTEPKASDPMSRLVLLTVGPEGVRFDATSIALGWRSEEPGEKPTPGVVAVPCHDFAARAAALPKGPVRLKVDGAHLKASAVAAKRSFSLAIVDSASVPPPQEAEKGAVSTTVAADLLGACIAEVAHAMSEDPARETMNGALLAGEGGQLVLRATDGHRLARVRVPVEGLPDFRALVPAKGVQAIRHFCSRGGQVELVVGERRLSLSEGSARLSASLMGGPFPPVDKLVKLGEQTVGYTATVARDPVIEALKALKPATTADGFVDVWFRESGALELLGPGDKGSGEGRDEVAYDAKAPFDHIERVNLSYLLAALGSVTTESVEWSVGKNETEAMILRPGDGAPRADSIRLVMPVRR